MQPQLFSSFPISDSYHYQNNCNIKIRFRDRNVGMCCLKTSLAAKMKERKCLTEVILSFFPFRCGFIQSFFFLNLFLYFWLHWVFIAALRLPSCGAWWLLFIVVCGLLTAVASLAAEHGL